MLMWMLLDNVTVVASPFPPKFYLEVSLDPREAAVRVTEARPCVGRGPSASGTFLLAVNCPLAYSGVLIYLPLRPLKSGDSPLCSLSGPSREVSAPPCKLLWELRPGSPSKTERCLGFHWLQLPTRTSNTEQQAREARPVSGVTSAPEA